MHSGATHEIDERAPVRDARLAGLLATGVSLAALYVISGLGIGAPFPPSSIAEALLRALPGGVATFFIELMGHWARPSLAAGAVLATLLLGSEALVLAKRGGGPPKPLVAAALLIVVAAGAVAVGPANEAEPVAVAVSLSVAALLYSFVATRMLRVLAAAEAAEVDESRRRALRLGLGGAVGIAVAGAGLGWLARRLGGPDTNVTLVGPAAPASVPTRAPFPSIPGLSPEITSASDHYVVDINLVQPSVEAEGWSLGVGGLVEKPLTLSFAELQDRFQVVEEYAVLTCISNEIGGDLIGNSAWGGVRLRDVLEGARVKEDARYSWTQWALEWVPPNSGTFTLACRATDGTGAVQTADTAPPHPSGATGYHFRDVRVG
ncbi:MAG: molybdopterin-dependent oxidoreductase [Actinobacteria bacterium]|nr:molybdopterin-dependent oxidoreductase [Actinomycetota bacterium]